MVMQVLKVKCKCFEGYVNEVHLPTQIVTGLKTCKNTIHIHMQTQARECLRRFDIRKDARIRTVSVFGTIDSF